MIFGLPSSGGVVLYKLNRCWAGVGSPRSADYCRMTVEGDLGLCDTHYLEIVGRIDGQADVLTRIAG